MKNYCLILLLVSATTFCEDAYDITTIVRFKNIDEILEEHDTNIIDTEQKTLTCTALEDGCTGWNTTNWDNKCLLETSIKAPNLFIDKRSVVLQNNKTDPISYQGHDLLVFSGQHFGIYLGQDTDIMYSDMNFIYVHNGVITLYKCSWSEKAETIIYGSFKRACTKLWTQTGRTNVYGMHISSPNMIIYQLNEQPNALYGKIEIPVVNYISFGGFNETSSVEFGYAKRFFSLQNFNGVIESPTFTWRSSLLCVSVGYFFPSYLTDHKRKIDVIALHNGGKELNLGQIKSHKDIMDNQWTTKTFFGQLGYEEQRDLKVQLRASSSLKDSHILIHEISIGCEAKNRLNEKSLIINKEASIECHSRTNALDLPMTLSYDSSSGKGQDADVQYIQPNVGVEYLTSNFDHSQQDWTLNNFVIVDILDVINPPGNLIFSQKTSNNITPYKKFYGPLSFKFKSSAGEGWIGIFLLENDDILGSNMYFIRLRGEYNSDTYITKCPHESHLGYEEIELYLPQGGTRSCSILSKTEGPSALQLDIDHRVKVKIVGTQMQVLWSHGQELKMEARDPSPLNVKFYSQGSRKTEAIFTYETQGDEMYVARLNSAEGSLESMPILPTQNQFCLSLNYYMPTTGRSIMQIQLKFEDERTLDIFEVSSTESVGRKWQHERLVINLSDYRNQSLQVVIKGIKESNGDLILRTVYDCNAQKSDEDVTIAVEEKSPVVGKRMCNVEDEKDFHQVARNFFPTPQQRGLEDDKRRNRTVSGSMGILTSPNHPGNYENNLNYWVRILGPQRTRILVKFSTLVTEHHDNCAYDYVGVLINGASGPERLHCGSLSNMDALTLLTPSNVALLHFRTDGSNVASGFKATWQAVDDSRCPYGNLTLTLGQSRYTNFVDLLTTPVECPKETTITAPQVSITLENKCENGGKYDNEKQVCNCPPGFSGNNCQTGCGENRYGRDCGGICSKTKFKCKGMILCTPNFGCTCAPGIEGILCHKDCQLGKYGAGCTETCGHCLGLFCDKSTGVCLGGCSNGYYAPYCLETYTVLSSSPNLIGSDYTSLALRFNISDYKGKGTPIYYQLQFRKLYDQNWMELQPYSVSDTSHGMVEKNITGLLPGYTYMVRVVLIDKDGSSYEKEDVPSLKANTECDVFTNEYNFRTMNVTGSSFEIKWQPVNTNSKMCPLQHYEVYIKEDLNWSLYTKQQSTVVTFTNRIPNAQYQVRVKAVTVTGDSKLSDTFVVTTGPGASSSVTNLRVLKRSWKDFQIHWDPPADLGGEIKYYQVSYQCLQLLACKRHICRSSAGDVNVGTNSVTLYGLYPLAQYEIKVAAFTGTLGQFSRILELVEPTIPDVQPSISEKHTERTNSSFTIYWGPPENCSDLNGFLYGYRYEVFSIGNHVPLVSASTQDTSATFTGLTPHTDYEVKVYLVTSGGWNVNLPLIIPASTRATTPGPVENLAVYKKGRRMLGVRWTKPNQVFGDLESFKITYHKESDGDMLTVVIPPQPCSLWNNMYCHTLSPLTPEEEYVVTVSARNTEVAEDGEEATIVAVTKEGVPSRLRNLHLVSRNSTSIAVEWDYPDLVNGVLRSFLINFDEIDSYDASSCCTYYPIKEYPVTNERPSYQYEFTDLNPASTYSISVSAKTVMMGQAVQLSISTHPPTPTLQKPSGITKHGDSTTMFEVTFSPLESLKELVSHYLVIVVNDGAKGNLPDTQIFSNTVMEQLQGMVDTPFYVAHELNQETLENNQMVVLGSGGSSRSSVGVFQDPPLKTDSVYRVGLAVVLEYDGAYAVGYAESEPFFTG